MQLDFGYGVKALGTTILSHSPSTKASGEEIIQRLRQKDDLPLKNFFKVTVLDSCQGEENEIVILSLVLAVEREGVSPCLTRNCLSLAVQVRAGKSQKKGVVGALRVYGEHMRRAKRRSNNGLATGQDTRKIINRPIHLETAGIFQQNRAIYILTWLCCCSLEAARRLTRKR